MLNFPNQLEKYRFWCQKVLPLVYSDELSYYEVLCQMAEMLNEMIANMQSYEGYLNEFNITYQQIVEEQKKINAEIVKIKNGQYFPQYLSQLGSWLDDNLQQLVAKIVTYVTFGLTNDGRFCAMIPQTWDFIQFETIMQPQSPLYGHLVLRW